MSPAVATAFDEQDATTLTKSRDVFGQTGSAVSYRPDPAPARSRATSYPVVNAPYDLLSGRNVLTVNVGTFEAVPTTVTLWHFDIASFPESDQILAAWHTNALQSLTAFEELKPNWDTYGAPPLMGAALERAKEVLLTISAVGIPTPSVLATSKGGVQFEWHTMRYDAEIEILPTGSLYLFFEDSQTKKAQETEDATQADLNKFVRTLREQ
jgi:hypothetical protein